MRKFSIRPTLTLKGRTFKGLRGWSGKPLHPPLTDFPIAAYVLAAVFDVMSAVGGEDRTWPREMWHAATFVFLAGAASRSSPAQVLWMRGSHRRPAPARRTPTPSHVCHRHGVGLADTRVV